MRAFLLSLLVAASAPAFSQDALSSVLRSSPGAAALAGSPENLKSLVDGYTTGAPVRLAGPPGPSGSPRVVAFVPRERLAPAQIAARLEKARGDFQVLGIAQPSVNQLAAALAGGVIEPEEQPQPTPEEQAVAALPADIRALVGNLPPKNALRAVELADQELVALGRPYAGGDVRRQMVARVLSGSNYVSASAGATSFPPLSPLVAAPLWQP
jgi:hypothetical protein